MVAEAGSKLMASKHISLPSAFAAGDPTEWFKRFEICCRANEWSDTMKALKLRNLLEGEALAVWMELSEAKKEDYKSAKTQMITRMVLVLFVSLEELRAAGQIDVLDKVLGRAKLLLTIENEGKQPLPLTQYQQM